MALIGSPLHWLTALLNFVFSPIAGYTRLQSSLPMVQDHFYDIINKYRPTWTVLTPTALTSLLKQPDCQRCDFTCFKTVLVGGSAVPEDLIEELKGLMMELEGGHRNSVIKRRNRIEFGLVCSVLMSTLVLDNIHMQPHQIWETVTDLRSRVTLQSLTPETEVCNIFGMTEMAGMGLLSWRSPRGSSGTLSGILQYRLINIDTGEDIQEANVAGELWIRGPTLFKGYYNNPEATSEAFADDGWFRTGDMFYRDENYYFYFVERIKLLLKYKSHQISPVELEILIRKHPGVLDVAVSSIPDPECGDLPVACVVKQHGHEVTAQEIKDFVKENLTDSKQLRGGVIFLPQIPMTATTKVHRRKLKTIVQETERE
ncbi:Luciferin 4-monooxygenase [Eumeta japonica]|uniref:Luciferin 4-monooxygenase n=1 Tax=Eumeta variegata TaxID=151549 RepID=A0A4C1VAW2_EUMVA|nr:Luciferin 4-monooxygenase [Eumeta japonica]